MIDLRNNRHAALLLSNLLRDLSVPQRGTLPDTIPGWTTSPQRARANQRHRLGEKWYEQSVAKYENAGT